MIIYNVGDLVRVSATWTNAAGTATDPTAVFVDYKDPAGDITTLTYGTDPELHKVSAGVYYTDIDADQAGHWHYRFYSTGTGQAANNGTFRVKPNIFAVEEP